MGSGLCGVKSENVDDVKSRRIDSELKKDHVVERKKIKILLLGSADSGKSTIVKQMRLIHSAGFNETEAIDAIFVIRKNLVDAFHAIAVGVEQTTVDIPEGEKINTWFDSHNELTKGSDNQKTLITLDVQRYQEVIEKGTLEQFSRHSQEIEVMEEKRELQLLKEFANLETVQQFLAKHSTWPSIPDNFPYFSSQLHRILAPDFLPNSMDIVHMRKATIGVHEFAFEFKKYAIRLIDVGGQRTERRKWIHFFEDSTAVMFVASLSSFDQIMEEDMKSPQVTAAGHKPLHTMVRPQTAQSPKNRLMDSIDLFMDIVKNEFLKSCSFILFLNKVDLFKAKLEHTRLADYFKDYTGDNDYNSASDFIQSCFRKAPLPTPNSKLYVHYTEAIDTQQIDFVFAAACDIILQSNLARAGMQ